MQLQKVSKTDMLMFAACAVVIYMASNIYHKKKNIEANYSFSLTVAILGAISAVLMYKVYKKNVKTESKLDVPFNGPLE